jgi:vitamin K-dependent gamma-carboxylase
MKSGSRGTSWCEPVDAASLGVFRMLFGAFLLAETARFILHGWIREYYLAPGMLFKYYGFEWVEPWPGDGLYWHFGLMGLLAAMVALGLFYRIAIVGLLFAFGYVFLLEQANYLNHYYLLLTLALILCFLPAERGFSLDALRWRATGAQVPRWSVWALRMQFELMLVYAGLVKLNGDWLQGEPLGLWLAARTDLPLVGPWLAAPGVAVVASYGVIALHLAGAPLLLWRRTRLAVFILYTAFHLCNTILFRIGIFPWITLAGTLIFFDPDWPRQLWKRLGDAEAPAAPAQVVPPSPAGMPPCARALTFGCLAVFFVFQLLFPLRSLLYPGNVAWTGEGHRFSWRMKLDDRRATARFIVTDPQDGRHWEVNPADYLRPRQAQVMATQPDMILQFAHYLAGIWKQREGIEDVEVRTELMYSLNGRPPAPLVDPARDLSKVPRTLKHQDWILPR